MNDKIKNIEVNKKDEEVFQLTIVIDDEGEFELEFKKYDEEE